MMGSCKKYLNTVPDDVLTTDDIFLSKTTAGEYLANIYSYLPNELLQRFSGYSGWGNSGPWTGSSDEAKYNWDFNYSNQMNASTWSSTDGQVELYWSQYYQAIRNATDFMARIPTATNEIESGTKVIWRAEARALRAVFYFYLLRTYGPVVLLQDNIISPDASGAASSQARTPFDACISYVVGQLDSAYTDLPLTPLNSELGRMTQGIAKAFKVEALLLDASPLYNGNAAYASFKNADGTQLISQTYDANKWTLAANAGKDFINLFSGTYRLHVVQDSTTFATAFRSCKEVMTDDWDEEWIFGFPNAGSLMRYDRTPKHVGYSSDQQGGGACGATQTMVDAYFMANGLPITDPNSNYVSTGFTLFQAPGDTKARNIYSPWTGREPRFYVGITYDSSRWIYADDDGNDIITSFQYSGNSGRSQSTSDVTPTGYTVRKNVAPNDNNRGCVMMRLAQIYLDYIEALNESDPSNPDILKYLNLIRDRAGVPEYGSAIPAPASQADMRTAIRAERRVELAFENVRFFDTRRWKIAPQTDGGAFYGRQL